MEVGLEGDRLEGFLELLEERMLLADCGPLATGKAIAYVRSRFVNSKEGSGLEVKKCLREFVRSAVEPLQRPLNPNAKPFIIMVAGINGGGKTTTIAKLAHKFAQNGSHVMVSTSDTFRAAAREQILSWTQRLGKHVEFIDSASNNPSAAAFDAVKTAAARQCDVLIVDTAGRLPNQANLMKELAKTKNVIGKAYSGAPAETMLVLDATNGRNTLSQLKAFNDTIGVTGLTVTKLDGTAKGGTILAIAMENPIPIRYVGVGEGMEDLLPFEANVFATALLLHR